MSLTVQEVGSAEEVFQELQNVITGLEVSAGVDPAVVQRYERLKGELDDCADVVKRGEQTQRTLRNQVASVLDKFNPALDSLVRVVSDEFSKAFEGALADHDIHNEHGLTSRGGMFGRSESRQGRRRLRAVGYTDPRFVSRWREPCNSHRIAPIRRSESSGGQISQALTIRNARWRLSHTS